MSKQTDNSIGQFLSPLPKSNQNEIKDHLKKIKIDYNTLRILLASRDIQKITKKLGLDTMNLYALIGLHYSTETAFTCPPKEIKPESINDEKLYQRTDASIAIASHLQSNAIPFCNQCFPAGKTSMMYKFREILNDPWSWPKNSKSLQDAIYLHIPINYQDNILSQMNFDDDRLIEKMLIDKFFPIFSKSLHTKDLNCTQKTKFISSVNNLAGDFKFLIHFDDVGTFDNYPNSEKVLYLILLFGQAFRDDGHYFVITGRSRHLLKAIGSFMKKQKISFQLIELPPLSFQTVISMFKEHKSKLPLCLFERNNAPKNELVKFFYDYTGGVPHAVNVALVFLKNNHKSSFEDVCVAIKNECGITDLHPNDKKILYFFIELSWSKIMLTNDTTICNESITDIIARLGIYRNYIVGDKFTLYIPQFISDIHLSEYNLMNIAKTTNTGDRLEYSFRRMFHLRTQLSPKNWIEFELPILNTLIPFPEFFSESLPFPKIASNGTYDKTAAAQCMHDINLRKNSIENSTFSSGCMSDLCSKMEIGRYYQPFEKSSSADAMVRCGDKDLLCFQFKNYQVPFKVTKLFEEVKKCKISGWNVTVVLVCSSGYDDDINGNDYLYKKDGVNGIILSSNSVRNFLGSNNLLSIASSTMYADSKSRQDMIRLPYNNEPKRIANT